MKKKHLSNGIVKPRYAVIKIAKLGYDSMNYGGYKQVYSTSSFDLGYDTVQTMANFYNKDNPAIYRYEVALRLLCTLDLKSEDLLDDFTRIKEKKKEVFNRFDQIKTGPVPKI